MIIIGIWERMPGKYFCLSTKSSSKQWKDHFFLKSEFGKINAFLKNNFDKDIYFCPHGFSQKQRKKEYAIAPNWLWADLDEADPSKIKPEPTIAIESSPGRFVGLWQIDQPATEQLNRDLTYFVGADKGGWDFTQVLRVPGTINYKYAQHPKVRVKFVRDHYYKAENIQKLVSKKSSQPVLTNAREIYTKYQHKFPHWLRRELLEKNSPPAGKRSEMVWKIENALLEAGCEFDEALCLIKSSVWNKFRGRQNEDEQLRNELRKAIEQRLSGSLGDIEEPESHKIFLANSLDEIEPENIEWLWHGRIPLNELTILEGDPGLGKSYLMQMIARHVCDGIALPDSKLSDVKGPGIVAYFDTENKASTVTRKRMQENKLRNWHNFFQDEQRFSIDDLDSIEQVERAIEKRRPRLVVFDTINIYIGGADTYRSSETQQALGWFQDIARRYKCAVVILRHLTKGSKTNAIYRGQGSIAFTGTARCVLTVGVHPDSRDERLLAVTKMNLVKPPKSLEFKIIGLPDTLKEKDRSRLEFGGLTDHSADDMLNAEPPAPDDTKDSAEEFLKEALGDGRMEQSKLFTVAEKRGYSSKSIAKASKTLGVLIDEQQGVKYWSLPLSAHA